MKVAVLTVVALLFTVPVIATADDAAPVMRSAPGVAEMLQRRQEGQLRQQLMNEGRLEEVRQLDELQAQRQQQRQEKIVAKMNDQLARETAAEAHGKNELLDACDRETLRMRQFNSANADAGLGKP